MAVELLKNEYETPWAQVRGAFLCDNLATQVSVLTGQIEQEEWSDSYTTIGANGSVTQDIWIEL
jgi:hypothetical protein